MQTPNKISLADFNKARSAWIAEHCITDGEFQRCSKCKTKIEILGVYFSMHDARFGDTCAGAGSVMRLVVPFCPSCEPKPTKYSCLHGYPLSDIPAHAARLN